MPVGEHYVETVAAEVGNVARQHRRVVMKAFARQNPPHVRPERTLTRGVRIAFLIRFLMVDTMRRHPEDRPAFERQGSADRQEILDGFRRFVTAVREQAVIRHPDAEHAGGVVQNQCSEHGAVVDVKQCGDGTDVETRHGDGGDPVQSALVFTSVHEHRCGQR
jgi:hypothetical protein